MNDSIEPPADILAQDLLANLRDRLLRPMHDSILRESTAALRLAEARDEERLTSAEERLQAQIASACELTACSLLTAMADACTTAAAASAPTSNKGLSAAAGRLAASLRAFSDGAVAAPLRLQFESLAAKQTRQYAAVSQQVSALAGRTKLLSWIIAGLLVTNGIACVLLLLHR